MSFDAKIISADGTMSVILDGSPYSVSSDHPKYDILKEAVQDNNVEEFLEWVNFEEKVVEYVDANSDGTGIEVKNGCVYYDGVALHNTMTERTMNFMDEGLDYKYMLTFMSNLMENPSFRSVEQLYDFLDRQNIPITEDGHFLGYKVVKVYHGPDFVGHNGVTIQDGDWVDKHSGRVRNNIGDVVEVLRNRVDDDPNSACSYGLHVGSLSYAGPDGHFGGEGDIYLIVKVNPKDVVSVPVVDASKLRCCKYEVKSEYKSLNSTLEILEDEDDGLDFEELDLEDAFSIKEIVEGDIVRFDYTHDGRTDKRWASVEDILSDSNGYPEGFVGVLEPNDFNYCDDVPKYRHFKFDRITNEELL